MNLSDIAAFTDRKWDEDRSLYKDIGLDWSE